MRICRPVHVCMRASRLGGSINARLWAASASCVPWLDASLAWVPAATAGEFSPGDAGCRSWLLVRLIVQGYRETGFRVKLCSASTGVSARRSGSSACACGLSACRDRRACREKTHAMAVVVFAVQPLLCSIARAFAVATLGHGLRPRWQRRGGGCSGRDSGYGRVQLVPLGSQGLLQVQPRCLSRRCGQWAFRIPYRTGPGMDHAQTNDVEALRLCCGGQGAGMDTGTQRFCTAARPWRETVHDAYVLGCDAWLPLTPAVKSYGRKRLGPIRTGRIGTGAPIQETSAVRTSRRGSPQATPCACS